VPYANNATALPRLLPAAADAVPPKALAPKPAVPPPHPSTRANSKARSVKVLLKSAGARWTERLSSPLAPVCTGVSGGRTCVRDLCDAFASQS
jgi:hypothetical protein